MGWGQIQFGPIIEPPKLDDLGRFKFPTQPILVGPFYPNLNYFYPTPFGQRDFGNWGSEVKIQQKDMSGNLHFLCEHEQRGISMISKPSGWSWFHSYFPMNIGTCRNISNSCDKHISFHIYHLKQYHLMQAMWYVPLFLMGLSENRVTSIRWLIIIFPIKIAIWGTVYFIFRRTQIYQMVDSHATQIKSHDIQFKSH